MVDGEPFRRVRDEVDDRRWRSEWTEELERRIEDIRTGRVEGIDAEQVFDEELARLEPSNPRSARVLD